MGIFRNQTERVAAFKAACAECKAEADAGKRSADELGEGEGECTECELPACGYHGRAYPRAGWQHESCHEAADYTRAEDGEY